MGLGKCPGWPFHDLDPRSRLWHQLVTICLSKNTHWITTKYGSFVALIMFVSWLHFREVLLETVILANFLQNVQMSFFKFKHYFGHISGMVGPIDVKRKGSASVGYWYNMWPSPLTSLMTLTLDVSRSNFEIAQSRESLVWLMLNEKEVSWYHTGPIVRSCPLTTPVTLTSELKFQVHGQSLKQRNLRNGAADRHRMKKMWVIHLWPWYWLVWPWWDGRMYRIMTGVTSDVGVPSTYLV